MDENQKTLIKAQTDVQIALATSLGLLAIALTLVYIIWQIQITPIHNLPFNSGLRGFILLLLVIGFFAAGIGTRHFAHKARQHRRSMN